MKIEFITENGDPIQSISLDCQPFKKGEIIDFNVNNKYPELWKVDELNKSFVILKIEHFIRMDYNRQPKVYENLTVSITLSEIAD